MFMHGFALLPFFILVFRFSSWFVPLFGYPIYGRRVGGQASVAKVRGVTLGRSQICDRTSFRIPCLNRERFMKVFFVSHILLEQRKVL